MYFIVTLKIPDLFLLLMSSFLTIMKTIILHCGLVNSVNYIHETIFSIGYMGYLLLNDDIQIQTYFTLVINSNLLDLLQWVDLVFY